MENGEETKRAPSKLLLLMEMDCSLRQRQTNKIINFITGILCELLHDKDTAMQFHTSLFRPSSVIKCTHPSPATALVTSFVAHGKTVMTWLKIEYFI